MWYGRNYAGVWHFLDAEGIPLCKPPHPSSGYQFVKVQETCPTEGYVCIRCRRLEKARGRKHGRSV